MTKLIQVGRIAYEKEKENPETGWVMVKNQNATSFWIPEELVKEINHTQKGMENLWKIAEQNKIQYGNDLQKEIKELKKKIDSQRKSITYYRTERDALQNTLVRESKESAGFRERANAEISGLKISIDDLEFKLMDKDEELEMAKRKATVIITVLSVIFITVVAAILTVL